MLSVFFYFIFTGNSATIEDLTLPASGSLRRAANDILLDILYYTSSRHCQLIVDHLTDTLNRTVETFLSRHPNFTKVQTQTKKKATE